MQNVGQSENRNIDKVNVQLDVVKSSTPQSSASSPAKSETETYSGAPAKYMTDSSESEDDSVSEAEMEEEGANAESKFLLSPDDPERAVDPEMQARLEALLEAAGIGKLSGEGKHLADPEVLRRLTSSVSCALDEAAAALTRMRTDQPPPHHRHHHHDKPTQCGPAGGTSGGSTEGAPSLAEACSDGDVGTVRKLLTEGRSVHETTEEGESLLSLACSAGYFELAQVLLAMQASVEDRGIKGDCTPLMEAASAGHVDIVRLLIAHGADVNAVSGSGNTPLMYACAGGHEDCVRALLDHGANVEDHNENGHTPLMEAASAGHVGVAKILLEHGAGINTHSNEFKESALTLACYKGHLDMVRFLLAAGADREHKTDEMHTALMEASMDGHVEVARLLLDSGAQVNMPTDSFESPLTLAACGGHVELAMLLLERGANIEEVNDEGYTPLMEAAREGHEEMVALLLGQGASINAQTEETQETALTLACCGGFLEVADFLIKAGADVELGASTPLMEASQEGHLELVRYLIKAGADVHAQTQTGDTALTYACENGHTDVAELLLRAGAKLEHQSEGGRTPLMKACRAGHLCTVQFLVGKGADVNRMTANGDHTPLSLACAGGHVDVVKFLLACDADPFRKLKDNSTTLIEAAKGGHTAVVQLLLDYPHSVMLPRGTGQERTHAEDPSGLSAAQAAALGLQHAAAPAAPPHRALLPAHAPAPAPAPAPAAPLTPAAAPAATHQHQHLSHDPANFAKLYLDGRKKQATATSTAGTSVATSAMATMASAATAAGAATAPTPALPTTAALPATPTLPVTPSLAAAPSTVAPALPTATPAAPVVTQAAGTKHKCPRKQRAPPHHSDHHLPPPPDILEDQRSDSAPAQARTDPLPEAERNLLELADATGPPTLATSALHALDLQFCAQGVTTIHPPTTPPYPPPQHIFPVQQLATTLYQHQIADLTTAQKKKMQQAAAAVAAASTAAAVTTTAQPHLDIQPATELLHQGGDELSGEACGYPAQLDMATVLTYLQREVPSLIALPPEDLRALITQVLQQKSHDILTGKFACEARQTPESEGSEQTGGLEPQMRRLLAVAEEALASDWPQSPTAPASATAPPQPVKAPPQPTVPLVIPTSTSGCQLRARAGSPTVPVGAAAGSGGSMLPPSGDPELAAGLVIGMATGLAVWGKPGATATTAAIALPQQTQQPQPQLPHQTQCVPDTANAAHFAPPPAQAFEDFRSATFAAPTAASPLAAPPAPAAPAATATPPQPHVKRDQPHHHTAATTVKKKNRVGAGRGVRAAAGAGAGGAGAGTPPAPAPLAYSAMDVDGETDSNRDTALTLACAGGHEDLVELLLSRGADIEHRDKKGFTPLILAATAGHEKIVEILLNHGADIEAQSERTKDTPLSLACSGGRYEVVELILSRGANKEHRNVSDYTPLSLAASGGYVNIIRLLLQHQAEINSRTGSKLGISPLMLAAMNGHTAAVRLLLDCGSDINAQIETNRNTALTLACFQGRHEVVSLLLDRKANVEHRAKTGLTPLMEAASGGYVEVGRVLLDKGADVNAPPVPSSRDTALTIAADKGHTKFVELLLQRRAAVEVKNKKGNSPLWLAANGGHLAVVEMLYAAGADIDSQDNRKVSCLMAAFRKGHTKVVKWMVGVVTQFPSDQEMTRYICTISDKEVLEKCQECVRVIRAAKETQAARANQNATILLEELDAERCREESRRQAAARRRERKKKKKMEKKEELRKLAEDADKGSVYCSKLADSEGGEPDDEPVAKEEPDSGIDANSQGSCSSSDVKAPPAATSKSKKKKKEEKATTPPAPAPPKKQPDKIKTKPESKPESSKSDKKQEKENVAPSSPPATPAKQPPPERRANDKKDKKPEEDIPKSITVQNAKYSTSTRKTQVFESTRLNVDKDDVETSLSEKLKKLHNNSYQWETTEGKNTSPKGSGGNATASRREDGWKEVVRKSSVQTVSTVEPGCKKVSVASHAISRVIGRAGSNINAIRSATGAHIEVDKQSKGQGERIITIKGSAEATKQAGALILAMIRDPDAELSALLPRPRPPPATPPPHQPKPAKHAPTKAATAAGSSASTGGGRGAAARTPAKSHAAARPHSTRTAAHGTTPSTAEKRTASATPAPSTPSGASGKPASLSFTGALVGARSHTFAAKLTAPAGGSNAPPAQPATDKPRPPPPPVSHPPPPPPAQVAPSPVPMAAAPAVSSPLKTRDTRESPPSAPPTPANKSDDIDNTAKQSVASEGTGSPEAGPPSPASWHADDAPPAALHINTTPQGSGSGGTPEYSLFKDVSAAPGVWGAAGEPHHNVDPPPPQVDASKAPGYRGGGGGCSPSSRTSSHGSTPPPAFAALPPHAPHTPQHAMHHHAHAQTMHTVYHQTMPMGNNVNAMDMSGLSRNGPIYQDNSRNGHNIMVSMSGGVSGVSGGLYGSEGVSRLNPRAPDFAQRHPLMQNKHAPQVFGGGSGGNLSTLLMSYQQPAPKHAPQPQHHHHPYQSLLERGMNVGWGGTCEEEERKPRPIGTERAWKMSGADEWPPHLAHHHHAPPPAQDHDRYQGVSGMGNVGVGVGVGSGSVGLESAYGGVGVSGGGGATAAALSLMQALPLHYIPPAEPPHHWERAHHTPDKQTWSKWSQ